MGRPPHHLETEVGPSGLGFTSDTRYKWRDYSQAECARGTQTSLEIADPQKYRNQADQICKMTHSFEVIRIEQSLALLDPGP